jgi:hypothetical protein
MECQTETTRICLDQAMTLFSEVMNDELFMELTRHHQTGMFMAQADAANHRIHWIVQSASIGHDDEGLILCWLSYARRIHYCHEFYRVDIMSHILIFKTYLTDDYELMVGYIIDRNPKTRTTLMDIRQDYIHARYQDAAGD